MDLTSCNYIGIILLTLDIIWIMFYYYYATVKIYNFKETTNKIKLYKKITKQPAAQNNITIKREEYQYLGHLWIRKKRGEYYLKISQEMMEQSFTTKYKIVSQSMFHQFRKGEKIHINFADQYRTDAKLSAEITVKNYISTSHQL